jgi:2-dehydro-3-deoxyphosphogluconate aldolase/(4S)-4-hydroxy-2-oxoglutarate aldolase
MKVSSERWRNRVLDIAEFKKLPVLGILRGVEAGCLEPLIDTIAGSGLKTIEITMNTKDAARLIRQAIKFSKKRLTIGAGTVLNMKSLEAALAAGAAFIVMPVLVPEVMAFCVKKRIPVFPGALTPQEIHLAWAAGASMVKVFPSNFFGSEYFKEIKGPFDDCQLLACGGVTPQNMKSYFANGAAAVSFGASVFKKEWLAQKDFDSIGRSVKAFVDGFNE